MKTTSKLALIVNLFATFFVVGQNSTLKTNGQNLTLSNGQTIILRGVNYPIINQGDIDLTSPAGYQQYIDEVALTGANSIRIPWYTNGQNWRDIPAQGGVPGTVNSIVENGHLNAIISYCIQKKMIPILSIHDDDFLTCKDNNWAYFNTTVMSFWTSPAILDLIENNKEYLIINLANEFDYVRWGNGSLSTELNTFKTNYNQAIANLRIAGIHVPIMIDAPDCGQSSTELLSIAPQMLAADPDNNLLFSAHAYWAGYASNLNQIQTKLDEAVTANVCFVFGEIAPNQDGSNPGECGMYDLTTIYPSILSEACIRNIGWLAWTFNFDCSSEREMSATSSSSNLTAFGDDVVNNSTYGLKSVNGCGASTFDLLQLPEILSPNEIKLSPNPFFSEITIESTKTIDSYSIANTSGQLVQHETTFTSNTLNLNQLEQGVYFLNLQTEGEVYTLKIVKN